MSRVAIPKTLSEAEKNDDTIEFTPANGWTTADFAKAADERLANYIKVQQCHFIKLSYGGKSLGNVPKLRACPVCLKENLIELVEKFADTCCMSHCAKNHAFCQYCLGVAADSKGDIQGLFVCRPSHDAALCKHKLASRQAWDNLDKDVDDSIE